MDEQIRRLQRQAAQGDISAKVSLLRHYLRLGLLKPYHVELAALYGDEASEWVEHDRARDSVGKKLAYWPPYDYSSEYLYLYPTRGCAICGGTGTITNAAKMSWRDPDTYYCECTSRPFGGGAFYTNSDDEIYVRRALAAVQYAFDQLQYLNTSWYTSWNVIESIINRIRRLIDTYGVKLPEKWEEFYEDSLFYYIGDMEVENYQDEFQHLIAAVKYLLDGCNHLYKKTEIALHTRPLQNWVEDAIREASLSILTILDDPRPGEDRVIINRAIKAELVPWLLDPDKRRT
jgi:hypothetical protein